MYRVDLLLFLLPLRLESFIDSATLHILSPLEAANIE
jgi:hypothetical protein